MVRNSEIGDLGFLTPATRNPGPKKSSGWNSADPQAHLPVTHPIDTILLKVINSPPGATTIGVFLDTVRQKGVSGLYSGVLAFVVLVCFLCPSLLSMFWPSFHVAARFPIQDSESKVRACLPRSSQSFLVLEGHSDQKSRGCLEWLSIFE